MPNRIIKESICTSEDLDVLSPGAEILFYRLIVKADDYGAYYGNEHIVKSTCFPLKPDEKISGSMVKGWLDELEAAGLIKQYTADGRKYIQLAKWDRHQQIRAKKRKFPDIASVCNQMQSDACNSPRNPIQSNPIRNPIQSNPNPIQNPNPNPIQYEAEPLNDLGRVMDFFMNRINPTPSPYCVDCLKAYTASLGADVVIHACGIAIDERKTGWSYIQGILQRYERDGLRSLDDVLRSEQEFKQAKERGPETNNVFLEIYDKEHGR